MFEDVFEPFDDIIDGGDAQEASDEWGDVWDTGEKEDMWRIDAKDVWTAPANQPVTQAPVNPKPDPNIPPPIVSPPGPMNNTPATPEDDQCGECNTECEQESCPKECDQGKGSGLFDDLFLDIF